MQVFVPIEPGTKAKQITCDIGISTLTARAAQLALFLLFSQGSEQRSGVQWQSALSNAVRSRPRAAEADHEVGIKGQPPILKGPMHSKVTPAFQESRAFDGDHVDLRCFFEDLFYTSSKKRIDKK